jgi:hypothetical protein
MDTRTRIVQDRPVAIAIIPDGPSGKWERIGLAALSVATALVVVLFLVFLIVEYVL